MVGFAIFGALIAGVFAWQSKPMSWFSSPALTASGEKAVTANFRLCHIGGGTNCVVDGDTIWLEGQNIRIADIDAPETHEFDCQEEKALGDRATLRLQEVVSHHTSTPEMMATSKAVAVVTENFRQSIGPP
ncbi:hypothetical protein [Sphingomonas daechungensis]|uniref:thermonuclease family protein n=1 Tax=Sphingomonas daechungensis TaxID=1176646 RepID=UPI0031EE3C5F